MITIIKAVVAN